MLKNGAPRKLEEDIYDYKERENGSMLFNRGLNKIKRVGYNFLIVLFPLNYEKFLSGGVIGSGCVVFPDVEFGREPNYRR